MKKFKIYRNYGCLSAEKRVKYTYGTEAATAVTSDELIVSLPEKSKGWEVYETFRSGLKKVPISWHSKQIRWKNGRGL